MDGLTFRMWIKVLIMLMAAAYACFVVGTYSRRSAADLLLAAITLLLVLLLLPITVA